MAERDPQTGAILAAATEVHHVLGHGFLETVYLNSMCLELLDREIPFRREVPMPVYYKEVKLECGYRADLLCYESVLVELKAQPVLGPADEAQALNYLRASGLHRALLLNFGAPQLQIRRYIWTPGQQRHRPHLAGSS
jgi:GxxExxY protein